LINPFLPIIELSFTMLLIIMIANSYKPTLIWFILITSRAFDFGVNYFFLIHI